MSGKNVEPETRSDMEERCRGLMENVVRMRVRYPAHLKKNDKVIANMEAKLLQNEIMRRVKPRKEMTLDPNVERLIDKSCELNIPDAVPVDDLIAEIENIHKIIAQTQHDKIHKLIREDIDSESILNKIRKRNLHD